MGNCLACLKVSSATTNTSNNLDYHKQDMPEVLLCRQSSSQCAALPPENHNNGNGKQHKCTVGAPSTAITVTCGSATTSETCGSLSRFCQRRSLTVRSAAGMGNLDSRPSEAKLNALFESYKDSDNREHGDEEEDEEEDVILAEGIERLCLDLQVSPDEFRVLVLAWKLNASQMCRFTRAEFVQGIKALGVDSVRGLQNRLPELVAELERDGDLFKDLYRFTFRFGLDVAAGQRILPTDMAVCLWRLVFTVRTPPLLERWLNFLELHPQFRGIPRDTWNMFLNFCESVGHDLSSYDDTEAWPSLFDDFVEYENDQMNQNISKAKESDGLLVLKHK